MAATEKTVTIELSAKEFRQLVFLGNLGAFIYQTTRDAKDSGVNSGFRVLHKVGMQGNAQGEQVMGTDERLTEAIDMAVLQEVITHNRDVMDRQEFWEDFETACNS